MWIICRMAIWDGNPTRTFPKKLTKTIVFKKLEQCRQLLAANTRLSCPSSVKHQRARTQATGEPREGSGWMGSPDRKLTYLSSSSKEGQVADFYFFRQRGSRKILLLDANWLKKKKNSFSLLLLVLPFTDSQQAPWGSSSVLDSQRRERRGGTSREGKRTDFHQGGFFGWWEAIRIIVS